MLCWKSACVSNKNVIEEINSTKELFAEKQKLKIGSLGVDGVTSKMV